MLDSWITPNELWFIRHHHPVPKIDGDCWTVEVTGLGTKPILLSLEDLKTRFAKHTITATIQCGGNRRADFNKTSYGKTSGIEWGFGAMSTAKFSGVLLRDVLQYSGLLKQDTAELLGVKHCQFEAEEGLQVRPARQTCRSCNKNELLVCRLQSRSRRPCHSTAMCYSPMR